MVVDSIASPFRYGFQDMGLRNRILSGLAQNLIQLAVTKHIAVSSPTKCINLISLLPCKQVVLTNQMTTKISEGSNKTAQLAPALGENLIQDPVLIKNENLTVCGAPPSDVTHCNYMCKE